MYVCTAQNDQSSVHKTVQVCLMFHLLIVNCSLITINYNYGQVTVSESSSETNAANQVLFTHILAVVIMFAVLCL